MLEEPEPEILTKKARPQKRTSEMLEEPEVAIPAKKAKPQKQKSEVPKEQVLEPELEIPTKKAKSQKRKSPAPEKCAPVPSTPPALTAPTPQKRKSEVLPEPEPEPEQDPEIPAKKAKLFGEDLTLTTAEQSMSVEEWIRFNAKQAAEHLRTELQRQVIEFDHEGKLALEKVDSIPVC